MTVIVNNPSFTEGGATPEELETPVDPGLSEEQPEATPEIEPAETEAAPQEGSPNEEEVPEPTIPDAPTRVKIGDKEYDPEELSEIVTKGSKIKEWEQKMPGFNVDTFMPDYTKKSQRLAEYEKRFAPKESKVDPKELEELGVDTNQIKAFEKVAKHLGFVRQTDLVNDSVEAQKEAFIARHPEYAPGTPGGDQKWSELVSEFNIYDWKNNPSRVEQFLEKAHGEVSKSWVEAERGRKVQETIVTKKAQVSAAAMGGGASRGASPAPSSNQSLIDKARANGWSEEDIKELLT